MRTTAKWVLGVVTLWLPLYFVFLFAVIAVSLGEGNVPGAFLLPAATFLGLHLFSLLLLVGLLVGYLFHVSLNERLSEEEKERWLALLLLGSGFAMPVYWWRHVRPAPEPSRPASPRPDPDAAPAVAQEWPLALGPSPRGTAAAPAQADGRGATGSLARNGDGRFGASGTTPASPAPPGRGASGNP